MEADQEHERFDVGNDYDGGEWIGGEFFYANKRQKRTQTKDDQIYGIFAEDGSDDERPGRSRGGLGANSRRGADYSKPVAFVGGGVVKHDARTNELDEDEDDKQPISMEKDDDDDIHDTHRPGLGGGGGGLGFNPASTATATAPHLFDSYPRGGLGIGAASLGTSRCGLGSGGGGGIGFQPAAGGGGGGGGKKDRIYRDNDEDDDDDESAPFLPTAFGRRIQQQAEQRRKQQAATQRTEHAVKRAAVKAPGDVGAFEAHTKGIGAKLLSKMGWQEGKGLGKEGRGIAKPLEAKMRPKGVGMGFGDRREPNLLLEEKESKPGGKPEEESSVVDVKKEATMWKKRNAESRVKRTFKTAEEVLAAGERQQDLSEGQQQQRPLQTIIDMRGPQTRVVTNLEHLNVEAGGVAGENGNIPMPELQHNIRLLVDLAEADIQKLDARIRHQKDTVVILEKEVERLTTEASHHTQHADRISHLLERLTWARSHDHQTHLSLEDLLVTFTHLHTTYKEEYVVFDVPVIALAVVLPLLGRVAGGWSPLKEPERLAADFGAWRSLLESPSHRHQAIHGVYDISTSQDPFMKLISELVLPPLRKELTNTWDPRDAAVLERFVETWERILPAAVLTHVMLHLVLPRLKVALQNWDPLTDPVALHTWIHPWLPFLGHEVNELLPTIRYKFTSALQAWHPADSSAHFLLAPWHKVFEPKDWELLLMKAIVPKLAAGLHELVINPADQDVEPFEWCMSWGDVMPITQLASLLDAHFFPKWHAVLRHWLTTSPDYDEITRWYLGWKALFPENLLHHQRIKTHMTSAMDTMNAAAQGKAIPPTWTPATTTSNVANTGFNNGQPSLLSQTYGGAGAGLDRNMQQQPQYEDQDRGGPILFKPQYQKKQQQQPSGSPVGGGTTAAAAAYDASELSLRELVERFAEEQGIDFLPKPGRTYEGLQMYQFGRVSCVIDNSHSAIKALVGDKWLPASMESLVEEHGKREIEIGAKKKKGGTTRYV